MEEKHELCTDSLGVTSCSVCGVSAGRYGTAYHFPSCPGTEIMTKQVVREVVRSRKYLYYAHSLPYNAEELSWQEILLGPTHDHLSLDVPFGRLDFRTIAVSR